MQEKNVYYQESKKIYFDSDTLIFQDSKNEGVFVFNLKDHKLVSHINRIGQGPEEYHKDNAIAVDSTEFNTYL